MYFTALVNLVSVGILMNSAYYIELDTTKQIFPEDKVQSFDIDSSSSILPSEIFHILDGDDMSGNTL